MNIQKAKMGIYVLLEKIGEKIILKDNIRLSLYFIRLLYFKFYFRISNAIFMFIYIDRKNYSSMSTQYHL